MCPVTSAKNTERLQDTWMMYLDFYNTDRKYWHETNEKEQNCVDKSTFCSHLSVLMFRIKGKEPACNIYDRSASALSLINSEMIEMEDFNGTQQQNKQRASKVEVKIQDNEFKRVLFSHINTHFTHKLQNKSRLSHQKCCSFMRRFSCMMCRPCDTSKQHWFSWFKHNKNSDCRFQGQTGSKFAVLWFIPKEIHCSRFLK